jgi:DNA-binding beta-propeller fold protein YncE
MLLAGAARGAALAPGDILVTDQSAKKLYVIDPVSGIPTELASAGFLLNPLGVAVRADGFAFLTDIGSQLMVGSTRPDLADAGTGRDQRLRMPRNRDRSERRRLVSLPATGSPPTPDHVIRVDTVTGIGSAVSTAGLLQFPAGLVREPSGDLVVADSGTGGSRILRIHPQDGVQTLLSSAGFFQVLRDIEIDPARQLPGGRLQRAQGLPGRRDDPVRPP